MGSSTIEREPAPPGRFTLSEEVDGCSTRTALEVDGEWSVFG